MVYEIQKLVNAVNNDKECMLRSPNGQCIFLFNKNDEFFEFIISKDIKNTFLSSSIRRDTLASVSFIGVSFIVSQIVQFACYRVFTARCLSNTTLVTCRSTFLARLIIRIIIFSFSSSSFLIYPQCRFIYRYLHPC